MQDATCPHCGHLLWFADSAAEAVLDFSALLRQSLEDLIVKNTVHQRWGLAAILGWDLDQEVGELVWFLAEGFKAVTPVQIIGSLSINKQTWLWAWENPSILTPLTRHAQTLKNYGEFHCIPRLTSPTWRGTNEYAWAMAALAANLCDAAGAYRGTADKVDLYMTFGAVEVIAP